MLKCPLLLLLHLEQPHLLQLGDDELAVHVIHLQLQLTDFYLMLLQNIRLSDDKKVCQKPAYSNIP